MLQHQGLFYIMNDVKHVLVLQEDKHTKLWELISTKELMKEDAIRIRYSDFDEFAISPKNLHYQDNLFYLFNTSQEQSPNFKYGLYNVPKHNVTYGPVHGRDTGMIWSI